MRLWSIHPKYLDSKGLVALWRESLLAKKVLEWKTNGYKNHPQLNRFKNDRKNFNQINAYLFEILQEAKNRGYNFDKQKINTFILEDLIPIKSWQIKFEFNHLLKKLKNRDIKKYHEIKHTKNIQQNLIFKIVPWKIEDWEKL